MSPKTMPVSDQRPRSGTGGSTLDVPHTPLDVTPMLTHGSLLASLQELQAHQIELEMQNEALRRRKMELDALNNRHLQSYDQAPVGYLTIDGQGLILEANLTAATLLGVDRNLLVGSSLNHFSTREDQHIYEGLREQLFQTGSLQFCELQMRRPDGSAFWASLKATATRLEAGGDLLCLMALADISLRKQAEARQQENEACFRSMINAVPTLIWIADTNKSCSFFNKTWLDFTGRSLGQELGDGWAEGVHPADLDRCLNIYHTHFDARRDFTMDYRLRRSDGAFRWVHDKGVPRFAGDGTFLGYIGTCFDITEQKESELQLATIAAWNKAMTDSANQAIISTSPEGLIQTLNPAAERMLGYSAQELLGKPIPRELHDPDEVLQASRACSLEFGEEIKPGFETFVAKARRDLPNEQEWTYIRKDGSRFPGLLSVSPIRGSDRGIIGFLGLVQNITERKRAEKERAELQFENEHLQRSESLGRMAGAIAHHFNNQLQVVILNLDVAMQGQELPAPLDEGLSGAMNASLKAAEMSNLMLTYLGQNRCSPQQVDLSETCRSLLPMLQATMPQNISFETLLPTPGPILSADPSQIQQVLMNLLTNAWEASGSSPNLIRLSGSTVAGSAIPQKNRHPIDRAPEDCDYACLEVSDSGCGIPLWDLHLIFDPFFSTKFTGRGLGLSVVLGIIRSNHGFITVESRQGSGSRFRVFLPLTTKAPTLPVVPAARDTGDVGAGAVMVVDDDRILRELLASSVERMGFAVHRASDGVEAVELFRRHQRDVRLVISDLTMPRMDGWDTLQALRKIVPGIPVILSSGHSESHVMSGSHSELPQAFLMKPYELKRLRSAIFSILETHQAARNT